MLQELEKWEIQKHLERVSVYAHVCVYASIGEHLGCFQSLSFQKERMGMVMRVI